jgi:hypothetical protein
MPPEVDFAGVLLAVAAGSVPASDSEDCAALIDRTLSLLEEAALPIAVRGNSFADLLLASRAEQGKQHFRGDYSVDSAASKAVLGFPVRLVCGTAQADNCPHPHHFPE